MVGQNTWMLIGCIAPWWLVCMGNQGGCNRENEGKRKEESRSSWHGFSQIRRKCVGMVVHVSQVNVSGHEVSEFLPVSAFGIRSRDVNFFRRKVRYGEVRKTNPVRKEIWSVYTGLGLKLMKQRMKKIPAPVFAPCSTLCPPRRITYPLPKLPRPPGNQWKRRFNLP